jgi:antitoxin (DNA-binding transcriptional repressor) of toxin-antitoxin stability system
MKKATLGEVQASLGDYVKTSATQPVLILRDGEPVALLVGLGQRKKRVPVKLRDVLKRAWKEYEAHGGMTHEQFWDKLTNERDLR